MTDKYDETFWYDSVISIFLINRFNLVLKATYLTRLHRFKYNSPRRVNTPIPERRIGTIIQLFISILQFTWLTFASLREIPKGLLRWGNMEGGGEILQYYKKGKRKSKNNFRLNTAWKSHAKRYRA